MSAGYVLFKIKLFNYMIVIVIDIEMWLKWGCGFSHASLFAIKSMIARKVCLFPLLDIKIFGTYTALN
jgi:hypothetical protein